MKKFAIKVGIRMLCSLVEGITKKTDNKLDDECAKGLREVCNEVVAKL